MQELFALNTVGRKDVIVLFTFSLKSASYHSFVVCLCCLIVNIFVWLCSFVLS